MLASTTSWLLVIVVGTTCCMTPVSSFSFQSTAISTTSRRRISSIYIATSKVSSTNSRLHESTSTSVDPIIESAASQWMENEKRLEEEIDIITEVREAEAEAEEKSPTTTADSDSTTSSSTNNYENNDITPHTTGRWEELHGNYIVRPPSNQQPRALIHFLGGAFLGAAPQLSYRYLLERLSSRGYLIVATPYQLSFDHLKTCDEIIDKFELVAPDLAKEYGAIPVVGIGHSCGSLLHMLITSLFPDTPRAANALISYNNRGIGEAVPFFEELIVPLFSDVDRNGSELMKAMIEVAREQYNGKVPSDDALRNLIQSIPTLIPGLADLITPSIISIPQPIRDSLTNFLTEPTYNALSNTGIPSLLLQTLDISQQVPKLIDEVEQGARDFIPKPDDMSSAARRAYRCRRTLLLQFNDDNLDDSDILEGYLKEAESVMKMKRPMITINLERKVLDGNHLTPLLGPSGGEEWGVALEETFGSILGVVDGGVSTSGSGNDEEEGTTGDDSGSNSNAKAVQERLGYKQVERVVDELAAWLDEGSL